MNRGSRLVIAAVWLAAGAFNLFAWLHGGTRFNLTMTILDAALALMYVIAAFRKH